MAAIHEKLADSLKKLQGFQIRSGVAVVNTSDLSRAHLERLVKNGFLKEVIKSWYILSNPAENPGDTTSWFASFWFFIAKYANSRFGNDWCLSAEQSLSFYGANTKTPKQVIIRTLNSTGNLLELIHDTSILYFKAKIANPFYKENSFGLNLYTINEALIECNADFFKTDPVSVKVCLSQIDDISDILGILADKGQTVKAGRLAGAFRAIGRQKDAETIIKTMKSFGYNIQEENPFIDDYKLTYSRSQSPYAARLKLMWENMRKNVLEIFADIKPKKLTVEECFKDIDEKYKADAYNSLSIEGYNVSDELVEKVKTGKFDPALNKDDAKQRDAMAARGYWQTFQAVKKSIKKILQGKNAGEIAANEHHIWYKELFSQTVSAGLLKPSDLIGYRNHQVYIRSSWHTPLNPTAVRDAMPVLFDLLKKEPDARVRAVLGHFFFVYIHPYMDGNGRLGRFLMNVMFTSAGYPWTIVPVARREEYMQSLEQASVNGNIIDFTNFIFSLMDS
ncbi:MAG: Fic family protein [Endomicrobia bacterium]|nr:Fic family protein [Endomicrobiia bacterium]